MKEKIMAYVRENGNIGVRNHVLVLSSVVCANRAASLLGDSFSDVISITHQHGCSQTGADMEQTLRTLAGVASNPNVAAVLIVGLGCESVPAEKIADKVKDTGKIVEFLEIQECGGVTNTVEEGRKILSDMINKVEEYEREAVNIDNIILGTECGGSDAFSGITANPAVGAASDLLVKKDGTVILSETPELIGAEHILKKRSINKEVGNNLIATVENFEKKALGTGVDIRGANPSPGNIKGGLTTLEEKSLGCIHKAGTSSLTEVNQYAECPSKKGLVVMDTPGNDVESLAGMAAGGAQIVVFTTGRGTPAGFAISPVIKIATNTTMYQSMKEHMDINAGVIANGEKTIEEVGRNIFELVIKVAEGKLTKAEKSGQRDFSINRIGPTF